MLLASRDQSQRGSARHAIIVLTDGIDSGAVLLSTLLCARPQSQTTFVVAHTDSRGPEEEELASLLSVPIRPLRFNELRITDLRLVWRHWIQANVPGKLNRSDGWKAL